MPLDLCRTVAELRTACDGFRARGRRVGLVPTMGALHAGHVALVREAARLADEVVVTIFVNPTQFGPNEDFSKYPRTLEADLEKCEAAGARLVFSPEVAEIYPAGEHTRVRVDALTEHLCGRSRPGHFEGVTTVVAKLFAATGACTAVFGRKDYQQLKVIERMTRDLLLPVTVVGHATVREPDGLALSSRNAYLSANERQRALVLSRSLAAAVGRFRAGERRAVALRGPAEAAIVAEGLVPDYVTLADSEELAPIADDALVGERALLALAVRVGPARLIDNVVLGEDDAPGASA